jgi:HD-GYP domain-containing protein (c-di-GMP phosphodiesterase class II)
MSKSQALLTRITALRQRLDMASKIDEPATAGNPQQNLVHLLERKLAAAKSHSLLLESALRQLTESAANEPLPAKLTTRARQLVEQSQGLLDRLHKNVGVLADDEGAEASASDPLVESYREAVAMTDATVRLLSAMPNSAGGQLRLCAGVEAILEMIRLRTEMVERGMAARQLEQERIDNLVGFLTDCQSGRARGLEPLTALAAELYEESQLASPLRFHEGDLIEPARQAACHSLIVAQVIARLAHRHPQLGGRRLEPIAAALIHDVGMLAVPAEILSEPGPLGAEQRRVIEQHTVRGAEIVAKIAPAQAWLARTTADHHERLDGTGYPAGLRNEQIDLLTRLVAVCDVYAAQCAVRSYRAAKQPRTALTDTLLMAEQGLLDRSQAERLLLLSFYPVGSVVELADGAIGVVVAAPLTRIDLNTPARPVVALLMDRQGKPLAVPEHLDLAHCEGRSIVRSLASSECKELLGRHYPPLAA